MLIKPGSIIFVFLLFLSCGKSNQQSSDNQTLTDDQTVTQPNKAQQETPSEKITGILLSYYNDLANEDINEEKYFAPNVEKFFKSENLTRDKVGKSIRNGFSAIENRNITLDNKSLNIRPLDGGYVAEFRGSSSFNKTGNNARENADFSNRVTFNEEFQIVAYEAIESPPTAVKRETRSDSRIEAAQAILQALNLGDVSSAERYIHPTMGFYLLAQPGAMSVPYACKNLKEVYNYASWFKDGIKTLDTEPKLETLPKFDCGNMFSKQGCFINDYPGKYEEITTLMGYLKEVDMGTYDAATLSAASKIESYVTTQVIDTDSNLGFLLGEIDGKWYLLVMDMASYECSA